MLICKKMAQILAETTAIAKNKKNTQQNFMFRGIDDVMNELHANFAKHGVFITTEIIDVKREERQTKSGGTMLHQFQTLKFTFWAEDGSNVSSTVIGEAMDSGDKAGNKCMSIALKYTLLQAFLIPTEDMIDPDSISPQIAPAGQQTQTKTASTNLNDTYNGSDVHKNLLFGYFKDLNLTKEHRQFMQDMASAVLGMPLKDIPAYLKPKAELYIKSQKNAD